MCVGSKFYRLGLRTFLFSIANHFRELGKGIRALSFPMCLKQPFHSFNCVRLLLMKTKPTPQTKQN